MLNKINNQIAGFGCPFIDTFLLFEDNPELSLKIKNEFKLHMSSNDNHDWSIYNQLFDNNNIELLVGGSALNIIRMTKYLLSFFKNYENNPQNASFFGSTANDKFGLLIRKTLINEEIYFYNQMFDNSQSGTNIVLLENKERTFYSNLGVSEKIQIEFIVSNKHIFDEIKIFYTDAYLIFRCKDIYNYIYKTYYSNDNLLLSLGMGSDITINSFFDQISEILPYVDLIILNYEECQMLKAKYSKSFYNDEDFLKFVAESDKKNKNKPRIIINTRSLLDTLIVVKDFVKDSHQIYTIPVNKLDINE